MTQQSDPVPSPTDPRIAERAVEMIVRSLQKRVDVPTRCGCGGEYAGHDSCRDRALIEAALEALSALQQRLEQVTKERETAEAESERRLEWLTAIGLWRERAEAAEATIARLKGALEKLVGASTREELEQLEVGLGQLPLPADYTANHIDAVHALLALASSEGTERQP